jgi:comEA protein
VKLNRGEKLAIIAVCLFLAGLLGYGLGVRRSVGDYTVRVGQVLSTPAVLDTPLPSDDSSPEHYIDGRLDINTASAEEFDSLPGIGTVLAERIVDYRQEHGAFTRIEELMEVSGIGEKIFGELEKYITIGGPT